MDFLRAVCGLPLGSTDIVGHSAMVNILGSAPSAERILAVAGAHLHLYGKAPREARKLGHVNLSGPNRETVLESVNITVNKNAIPFDPRPPRVTSGLRLGTPAVTSRGFGQEEMRKIARLIATTLAHMDAEEILAQVREEVREITLRFPVPGLDS